MQESKDLKTGDQTSYEILGQKVILKPVTLGKMKKTMEAFKRENADTFEMMIDALVEILANGQNPFATREWIAESVTMPTASQMIADFRTINGLGENGFFQTGTGKSSLPETRALEEGTQTH